MIGFFASERAVVCNSFVAGDVVQAVLDEVRLLHARKHETLFAVELLLHCVKERVFHLIG